MLRRNCRLVYITAKDRSQALTIGRTLIEERLAACVNIIGSVDSLYWWKGSICRDREAVLIVKTTRSLVEQLTRRVRELHSYTTPCVVSLPIESGNKEFLDWVICETASFSSGPMRKDKQRRKI